MCVCVRTEVFCGNAIRILTHTPTFTLPNIISIVRPESGVELVGRGISDDVMLGMYPTHRAKVLIPLHLACICTCMYVSTRERCRTIGIFGMPLFHKTRV